MPVWLTNLQKNLDDHPVAILHGNLRDKYIDEKMNPYDNLGSLILHLAEGLQQGKVPLTEVVTYVPSEAPKRITLRAVSSPAPKKQTAGKAGSLRLDESAPPENVDGGGAPVDPLTVVATWFRELTSEHTSRMAVLYYLDKLVPYSTTYAEKDRQLLVWLERMVDKITPNNRLILVALRDTMVPLELYTSAPNAFIHAIPTPDAKDREAYLRYKLRDVARSQGIKDDLFQKLGNLTDGLFLRDLDNIAAGIEGLSVFSEQEIKRLLNRYRFGEQKDYFGDLSISRIQSTVPWFEGPEGGVTGQTDAIERIKEVLTVARAGLSGVASGTPSKPKGVLFFAGPTGVGKTMMAKVLAKFLFGDENACLRFDMSEYMEEHSISKLIGSPPGYVGSQQGGMLTNGVREKPFSVVLFDEIEKANVKIMDIFLQILDDGRLTDSRGQTVFFTETIIVFTSNIGTRAGDPQKRRPDERGPLEQIRQDRTLDEEERKRKIREHFRMAVNEFFRGEISRPELLNRFGRNIIPFDHIDDPDMQTRIFSKHLKRIENEVEDIYRADQHNIEVAEEVPKWLGDTRGPDLKQFGGRGIVNCLDGEVILPLAVSLLRAEDKERRNVTFQVTVSEEEEIQKIVVNDGAGHTHDMP